MERFFNWLGNWLDDSFGINLPPGVFKVLKWLIYALMAGLVIYLTVKLLIKEKFNSIFTKTAKNLGSVSLAEEHIEKIDLDRLLAEAIKENNYRLAVRYHFLKLLQLLSKKELIDWHFEKTNSDYQKEITQTQLKNDFSKLAYLYDYVWYGEQPIDETSYALAQEQFSKFNGKLGIVHG